MRTPLGRTRLIACLVSSVMAGAHLWLVYPHYGALAALVLLLAVIIGTYRLDRPLPGEPVLVPALLAVVGTALVDPLRTLIIAIPIYATQALHGSQRSWAVRTVLGLAVIPVSVALVGGNWHSTNVLGVVPFVLPVGLVMRNIFRILTQQQTMTERDRLLATAGTRLLAAADVEEVHAIGADLSARMLALSPGTVMVVLRPDPAGLRVLRALGGDVTGLDRGRLVPDSALSDPLSFFAGHASHVRHWHTSSAPDRHLLLGSAKPIPEDVAVAFRNLQHQVILGETSRRMLAELQHRAHHDDLTQLANRELFRQRLEAAMADAAPGTVALCTVDLDDFKQVNDTFGHGAGDDLLVDVAARLEAAAGANGTAARLGGDEFALLLTGLSGPDEAVRRAAELGTRLSERGGASIGVATTTSTVSVVELLRQADMAMYAAKARGKNRVEHFSAGHHAPEARPEPGSSFPAWSGSGTRTP